MGLALETKPVDGGGGGGPPADILAAADGEPGRTQREHDNKVIGLMEQSLSDSPELSDPERRLDSAVRAAGLLSRERKVGPLASSVTALMAVGPHVPPGMRVHGVWAEFG